MEDKLLNEINRFREITKLPLLTEQMGWLDDLIRAGTKRFTSLDDVIKRLGYQNEKLTDNEIDDLVDELKASGLDTIRAENVRNVLKNDANVRKALTTPSDDFVTALKNASKTKIVKGFGVVESLTSAQTQLIAKNLVTKFLNDPTSAISKSLGNLDDIISKALQKIYDNGEVLNNVDEMYDVFDGFINKILSENKVDDELAEQILQSFKTKYRSNSKTKDILEKFKAEGRGLNKPKTTKTISKFDKSDILSDEWLNTKKWKGIDDAGIPIKHVPPVVDDVVDDVVAVVDDESVEFTVDFDNIDSDEVIEEVVDPNFFNRYGGDIDFEFLEAGQFIKVQIGAETSAADKVILKKVLILLKKGKKIKPKDFEKIDADLKRLLGDRYTIIRDRLLNPKFTKLNLLQSFYWRSIEPLIKKWREVYTPAYFDRVAKKCGLGGGANFDFYFNDFKNRLETYIFNFDPKNATIGELRKLKDEFVRLRSAGVEKNMYYDILWKDMDDYIKRNLDAESLKDWNVILDKLKSEKPSNWRYMTWREITGDVSIIKKAESSSVGSKSGDFNPGQIVEDVAVKSSKSFWIKYGSNVFSYFMTGNIKTPKDMQAFLVKHGYAKYGVGGLNLSAGGSNFLSMTLWRYVYLPLAIATIGTFVNEIREWVSGSELDNQIWYQHLLSSFWNNLSTFNWVDHVGVNKEFEKYAPEWYSWFKGIMKVSPPFVNTIYTLTASAYSDRPTPEEQAHEYVDEIILEIENTLSPDNKVSKETMEIWKSAITGPMVRDTDIYNLSKETADKIVKNMKSVVSVDPILKKEIHGYIGELAKKGSITEKLLALKEINSKYKDKIIGSAITDIVVKTYLKTYKLVNSGDGVYSSPEGKPLRGIVFMAPDYEELKTGDTNYEYYPLNELKF